MKNFNKSLLALLLAAFALFGAGNIARAQQGSSLPATMVGQEWTLINYQVEGQMSAAVLPPNPITIKFTGDGAFNGSGGCNSYGGQYQAGANNSLTLSQIISTLMACADNNVNQWEGKYFAALQTVSGYNLNGDNLQIIFNNGQGTLTFTRSAATPEATATPGATGAALPAAMIGPVWTLISYQVAGESGAAVLPQNPITITFDAGGQAGGSGGCNNFSVQYQAGANNSLTISQIISTKRACIIGLGDWEAKYFTALQSVSAFTLNGDNLQLTFNNGQGTLTFTSAAVYATPEATATTGPIGPILGPLPITMINQQWNLISYQVADQANAAVLPPNPLTIVFDGAGQASGTGGCNSYGAQYQAGANNSLTLSQLISTDRACTDQNINQWEQKYFAALQAVNGYTINGDNLQLSFNNGQGTLTFEKAGVISRPTVGVTTPGMPITGGDSNDQGWIAALIALVLVAGVALRLTGKRGTRRS